LKDVMIPSIHDPHVDRGRRQSFRGGQAGEAAADDEYFRP
jgi:hypothetical protein